ncbi:MAG: three-Cys-motif partner protein TcmP [candidate division Zixibacteria bacterium]|nr:three-Cys-motif partner protein TcmP [candidate division Zixibacteria bacterium]MDD5427261.1 three-Cys-motif partner protein TcmP [candidate division Zixibacteria bacterium]
MGTTLKLDEIGPWSEIKLEIIKEYAKAYSIILSKQSNFNHIYIDAFAGAGIHKLKKSDKYVSGSPLNALNVSPPFKHYFFIDINDKKTSQLKSIVGKRKDVTILSGDCNIQLLNEVFPKIKYEEFKRALCLLDPYGLHLNWEVLVKASEMKTIEIFLNFPLFDMNRNVLWRKRPTEIKQSQSDRMNAFWGDGSWRDIVYNSDLFDHRFKDVEGNKKIGSAFKERLKKIAGFKYVPEPIPMRCDGKLLYYLFFSSHNETGSRIAKQIFDKYRIKT